MTYVGVIQNGVVVLPPDAKLPDGTEVSIEPLELTAADDPLVAAIAALAKPRPDWPKDFVLNHGHYTGGEPLKS